MYYTKQMLNISIKNKDRGYTLIELMVVIVLIGILLFFTIPRFYDSLLDDHAGKTCRWIIGKVNTLKKKACQDRKLYTLHVGIDFNRLWVTDASMSDEDSQNASQAGYELSNDLQVIDVEYPDERVSSGTAEICFYKSGYSDKAIIHMQDNDDNCFSFLIEPFLQRVKLIDDYVEFEG